MNPRRPITVLFASVLLLAFAISAPAQAAKRVALVIGNAEYRHASRLANPLNDAADIAAALGRLGFAVTRLDNAGYDAMRKGLRAFTRAAATSEIAVVFYAGHGIEVDGRNFLIPVDARLASDQDVEYEAVPLDLVSRSVDRASELRLIVLDACRDNPFAKQMTRSGATRSIGRGLARVEPAGETLVAYAAKGGSVAADGEGRNSPYSTALLAHLEQPGLEVGLMFRKVRDAVLRTTGGRQEPFVYGSLSSKGAYLGARPRPSAVTQAKPAAPPSGGAPNRLSAERVAAEAYKAAERLNMAVAFEAVIERFPNSVYAKLARGHIARLKRSAAAQPDKNNQSAVLAPKPAPAKPAPPADPAAAEAALKLTFRDRSLIQWGLSAAGFDPGPADGAFGPRTRAALRAWQESNRYNVTGHLTNQQKSILATLGSAAKKKAMRKPACPYWNKSHFFYDLSAAKIRQCLSAGANPNAKDEEGETILMKMVGRFAYEVSPEIVQLLISAGADPNARDNRGSTVLSNASLNVGDPEVIRILLEAGADPLARVGQGFALGFAMRNINGLEKNLRKLPHNSRAKRVFLRAFRKVHDALN